jgi:hypothetical protein
MSALLNIFIAIVLLNILLILIKIFRKRAYIYYYFYDNGKRYKLYLGYIKPQGIKKPYKIINVNKPRGSREVGEVQINEQGKAVVRLLQMNRYHENEFKEKGYVSEDGIIFNMSEIELARIHPHGKRYWYEFWLRCHAEVTDLEDEIPSGKVIETGRLRKVRKSEITLLSRAAATLLLYEEDLRPEYETASFPPNVWANTAFVSSLVFASLYILFCVILDFWTVFPFLGKTWSFIVAMYLFFILTWAVIRQIKIELLLIDEPVTDYLELINRNTGHSNTNKFLVFLLIAGLFISIFYSNIMTYVPLFLALLTGMIVNMRYISNEPWTVIRKFFFFPPCKGINDNDDEDDTDSTIEKHYEWLLDSSISTVNAKYTMSFNTKKIDELRTQNPFFYENMNARENWTSSVKELLLKTVENPKIYNLICYIMEVSERNTLSMYETCQFILDFVQKPNIDYEFDEMCDEIGNYEDYARFPIETLYDKRGDCDCKAVLAAALFGAAGIPTLFILSHNHAAIAVHIPREHMEFFSNNNAVFTYKGKQYYYCETTGDFWVLGQIPDKHNINEFEIIDLTEL